MRRFPLQNVHDLSRNKADAAARRLHQLKAHWQAAENKLEELRKFRREYEERLRQTAGHGMKIHKMRDFHAFLSKLDHVMRAQGEEVARCRCEWEKGLQHWQEQHRRLNAYDALAKRHMNREIKRDNLREQRHLDELATRSFLYRHTQEHKPDEKE